MTNEIINVLKEYFGDTEDKVLNAVANLLRDSKLDKGLDLIQTMGIETSVITIKIFEDEVRYEPNNNTPIYLLSISNKEHTYSISTDYGSTFMMFSLFPLEFKNNQIEKLQANFVIANQISDGLGTKEIQMHITKPQQKLKEIYCLFKERGDALVNTLERNIE